MRKTFKEGDKESSISFEHYYSGKPDKISVTNGTTEITYFDLEGDGGIDKIGGVGWHSTHNRDTLYNRESGKPEDFERADRQSATVKEELGVE